MPYDGYRLYQIERGKNSAEIQRADEQAARLASAVSTLLRAITPAARAARGPYPADGCGGAARLPEPAA